MKINLNLLLQKEGYFRVSHVETYIKKQFAIYFSQPLAPSTRTLTQVLMRIQVIVLLLGFCLAQANAWTYGQQITLKTEKGNLETILKELERQSGYTFFYKKNEVTQVRNMSVNLTNVSFENALETVLKKADFDFDLFGKTVVLKKVSLVAPVRVKVAPVETGAALLQQFIRGKVVDEEGKPIGGASIRLKSNTSSVIVSGEDGSFTLPLTALNEVIVVSYLGYAVKELKASLDANQMVVRLQKQEKEVDEVVITGMLNRRKETFTGSSTTYTIDELKSIGNTNVIQSLRTLDPSFLLMENNLAGSNPNTLATIELRGTTSITTDALRDEFSEDPNQPLFILDGFPTTLRVITDLDMNRIESITLLKDAASTAMYGSRASNGVVVVETIRPKANEITINYSTDVNFDFPDLRSYNMMNAAEKLEFEKLSGRYDIHPRLSKPEDQMDLDQLYAERLQTVLEGVDSYWLSDPLRNAYSQRHSLFINGGERQLSYTVGGDYRYNRGIMKGSSRDTWGTRFNVSYRGAKLNLSNQLYINGYSSNESPHGNFSKWVDTNPYFRKVDPSVTYLAAISNPYSTANTLYVENPFNSAFIGNYDRSSNYKITNNALARYDITKKLRAEASLQIEKSSTGSDEFTSPRDASFRQTAFVEKGKLTNKEVSSLSYTVNGSLVYNNVLNDKHAFNGLLRGEIHNRESASAGYTAIGFPSMSNGNPRFAYGYALNSRPQSSMVVNRRTSLVSTLNYSFDTRYNADLTYSLDGTTAFGSDNIFSSFYSVGASWNLHRENFVVEALPGLDQLRVRANYGVTGNQNFTSYTSVSTYEYISGFNAFGQGVFLNSLGNSDLEWQNTYQSNFGLDVGIWRGRLRGILDMYRRRTDPLVVAVALPPSTSLSNYPMNAGTLTVDGMEATLTYFPIFRPSDRVMWSLRFTGATNKQIYSNFNNVLEGLNNNLRTSQSLIRYRDGGDAADIWSVVSRGIDPATGLEVFQKLDGSYSFQYDFRDAVVVGNSRPKYQGVVSTSVTYKGFTANIAARYIYNQDVFNSALYDKVENISMAKLIRSNQDRRALYDRWKNPGDISQFRTILLTDYNHARPGFVTSGTDATSMSSRFVQREDRFSIESVNLGYEFRNEPWLDKYRLSTLRLSAFMNEIAYWSTVLRERGIQYPYARSVSFSVSVNFK